MESLIKNILIFSLINNSFFILTSKIINEKNEEFLYKNAIGANIFIIIALLAIDFLNIIEITVFFIMIVILYLRRENYYDDDIIKINELTAKNSMFIFHYSYLMWVFFTFFVPIYSITSDKLLSFVLSIVFSYTLIKVYEKFHKIK